MSGVVVRFDCPHCGPTHARDFRVVDQRLWLCCDRCGRGVPGTLSTRADLRPGSEGDPGPFAPTPPGSQPRPESMAGPKTGNGSSVPVSAASGGMESAGLPSASAPPKRPSLTEPRPVRGATSGPHAPADAPPETAPGPETDAASTGAGRSPSSGATVTSGSRPRHRLEVLEGGGRAPSPPPRPGDTHAALTLPPIPPGLCPSCLRSRAAAEARCAGCGLDFLKADPAAFAPSARLSRDWATLSEGWDDPDLHDRFLERATAARELREAGRLYRLHLHRVSGDPMAQRALERLMTQTLATALVSKEGPLDAETLERRRRQRLMWAILLLVVLLAGLARVVA